ncbi:KxYKxGKxW signal peptide domain-containing protein [Limosilactobacillus agrestimuris]|uniref:KxYKxGKxW signal peptide domain-containing protein n=1 Tax=Limosilactobacillus agrestimuris TaxID=2941331 RepID=UPI003B96F3FC
MNSRKKRFKLYKSGKQWITAAIVSIGFIAGTQVKHVHADTTTNQIQTTQTQTTAESNASQSTTLTIANNENSNSASASVASAQAAATQQNQNVNAEISFAQSKVVVNTTNQVNASSQSSNNIDAADLNNQASDIDIQSDVKNTGWQKVNDNWHYIKEDGTEQTGWYRSQAGLWYYFDPTNSNALKNWQKIDGYWYHFDPVNAWADTNWQNINNHWYYFDPTNADARTGWFKSNAGNWYYFDPTNADARTGWFKSQAGLWYYFDLTNAWVLKDWQYINNHWYHFDPINVWADTGWFKSNAGNWYYFDPANADARTGWFKSQAGLWYYFDPTNAWALKNWQYINNHWYYFDTVNVWADTGWQRINGKWYYMDPTNAWMLTGNQEINGKTYTFNSDGSWADGWDWPFPQDGEGYFGGGQLFGVHAGGGFRLNGFHDGLDFGSIDHPGREVHAIHGGTVKIVGYGSGLSWYAVVDTGEYLVVYQEAFSSKNNILVHEGQQISTGDVIGIRDTSHVHIGITRDHNFNHALASSFINNGTWLDPQKIIREGL